MKVAVVAVGGALGAITRYGVSLLVARFWTGDFPLATFLINVSGSFLLGIIAGMALYHAFPDTPAAILGSGFCGAYTTFSTFEYETQRLTELGSLGWATVNVVTSVLAGYIAVQCGVLLARR
jgi:CrcB protein